MVSEKERAAYYQAHKDDPDVWDELEEAPDEPRAQRAGLSVSIAVRFPPDEAEAIRRTARLEGKTYSEIVRTAVQRYTQPAINLGADQAGIILNYNSGMPLTQSGMASIPTVIGMQSGSETRSSVARIPAP
jgi:hypothetical protein